MTTTSEHIAIKTGYEVNGMTIEEIAEDRGMEVVTVKAALAQSSPKYRKEVGLEIKEGLSPKLGFTQDQLQAVTDRMFHLAIYAEDEHLQGKMCQSIRDDALGRKEIVKAVAGQTFNLLQFNESISQVREMANQAKHKLTFNV